MEMFDKDGKCLMTVDTQAIKAAKEWCARATPYIEYLQQQEKYYIERVHDLYVKIYIQSCLNLSQCLAPSKIDRSRRGVGSLILSAIPGLITLAVESVSSWIKGKQQR